MCTTLAWCCGSCACKACTECLGASLKQQVRLSYFIFDMIFLALAILIVYGLSTALASSNIIIDLLKNFVKCPADQDMQCLGISAVFRISLALVVMHAFILFWLFCRNNCSKNFNEGVWILKAFIVIGAFIAFFFISNSFFEVYSKVIMVLSLFFILFQIIMIIDIFYIWGTSWIKRYDAGQKGYAYPLIGFSIILYAATLYGIVRSYIWFSDCGVGIAGTTVTLVLILIATILIFAGTNPDGSLLTTGAVAAYATFFTWSGLSNMSDTCNPLLQEESTTIVHLVFGVLIIIISLLYVSIGKSTKSSGYVAPGGIDIAKGALADDKGAEYKDEEKAQAQKSSAEAKADLNAYQDNSFIYFHVIMIFASFYIAMLLTNWNQPVIKGQIFFEFRGNELGMWIKLGSSWVTLALYNWTLIAPKVFPNRDFS